MDCSSQGLLAMTGETALFHGLHFEAGSQDEVVTLARCWTLVVRRRASRAVSGRCGACHLCASACARPGRAFARPGSIARRTTWPPEMLFTMRVGGLKHAGDVVLVRQLYGNLPMPQLKHRRHE